MAYRPPAAATYAEAMTSDHGALPVDERIRPQDWPTAIADSAGAQIIVAGPGAGKTEFLVRRAAHLIDESDLAGSALLALTFSRRSAADLRTRIGAAVKQSVGGLNASTLHSFAYRFLELHGPSALGWSEMPSILTGPEQVGLVSELLAESSPSHWPLPFRDLLTTRTLASEVTDFILRSRERLIGAEELARRAADRDDWRALPHFLIQYDAALERLHRIDYGTLQATAVALFDDPSVQSAAADQFHFILVDEYQDTTVAQATLLRALSLQHGHITVAADPYQSIYSFRGTELSNVSEFPMRFAAADGTPARRRVLATSFRVPAEILRAAERVTTGGALPGAAGPVDPAPHTGRVDIHVFDQQSEEADWIAGEIARGHLEELMPYHRMAVVMRTKRRLLNELSRALERRNIPHDEPDARLADHPATQMIFDIVRAARGAHPAVVARSVRRLLLGSLFTTGIGAQRQLERELAMRESSWPDVIRSEVPDGEGLACLLEDSSWTDLAATDGLWHVWTTLPQFDALVQDPERAEFRAAWASLSQALSRLAERTPDTTLAEYVELTEADDFEASPLLSFRDPREDRLTLTTLHQAKGLEFDVVFIADAVEGVLPDMRQRQSLLQTEQLNPELTNRAGAESRRRLQEEMRLVYTAMTRARTRVVWTATSAGIDEAHNRPSRFLAAVAGDEITITHPDRRIDRPITPQEAEAWMRGILTDPVQPGHRRLAAAYTLSTNTHPDMRRPHTFAMMRDKRSDLGLLPDAASMSPSQADAYTSCPRRYALERRLRVGDTPSFYMTFGLMIHSILERTETLARDEQRQSTLAEALEHLDSEFQRHDFGTGSWKEAWKRRATELFTQLYDMWPHPGAVPVLLEHPLTLDLEGTTWRGVVDRIETSEDGSLRIVDYKTGKRPPVKKDAEASLQLGFYLLAAAFDDTVGAHGTARQAEYWYPLATPTRRVTAFDPERIEEVRAALIEIAERIKSEDWTPTPGDLCRTCAVKLVCPAWPEGQEAFAR